MVQMAARTAALAGALLLSSLSPITLAEPPKVHPRGKLWVTPVAHVECASESDFVRGESVLLSGGGFAPNARVRIVLMQGDVAVDAALLTVKRDGSFQSAVSVPTSAATQGESRFEARLEQDADGSGLVLRSLPVRVFADAGDRDSDGVPDICDNCPAVPSSDQADDDGDGIGNPCDACPADRENDSDGDGLCGDVDPDPYSAAPGAPN